MEIEFAEMICRGNTALEKLQQGIMCSYPTKPFYDNGTVSAKYDFPSTERRVLQKHIKFVSPSVCLSVRGKVKRT